jgi:hypothetical protein
VRGALVFRPTGGDRVGALRVGLDDERTTTWVVQIGIA